MMGCNHVKHLLVEDEDIVEVRIEGRQKEEEGSAEDGIAEVTQRLGIAEQDSQLSSPIDLRRRRQHDEEDSPEAFASFQQDEGKDIDISHDDVVLVAEDGLQHNRKQEDEDIELVLPELAG